MKKSCVSRGSCWSQLLETCGSNHQIYQVITWICSTCFGLFSRREIHELLGESMKRTCFFLRVPGSQIQDQLTRYHHEYRHPCPKRENGHSKVAPGAVRMVMGHHADPWGQSLLVVLFPRFLDIAHHFHPCLLIPPWFIQKIAAYSPVTTVVSEELTVWCRCFQVPSSQCPARGSSQGENCGSLRLPRPPHRTVQNLESTEETSPITFFYLFLEGTKGKSRDWFSPPDWGRLLGFSHHWGVNHHEFSHHEIDSELTSNDKWRKRHPVKNDMCGVYHDISMVNTFAMGRSWEL